MSAAGTSRSARKKRPPKANGRLAAAQYFRQLPDIPVKRLARQRNLSPARVIAALSAISRAVSRELHAERPAGRRGRLRQQHAERRKYWLEED